MALSPWTGEVGWPRMGGALRPFDVAGFPTAGDLFHDLEKLVDLPLEFGRGGELAPLGVTTVDVVEGPTTYTFRADLPGYRKDEVKLQVQGRNLTISGERKREELKEGETWRRQERQFGRFVRTFRLPATADLERVDATCDNGVLQVTIGKREEAVPETKAIEIK